jgi:flagellar FliJ protein
MTRTDPLLTVLKLATAAEDQAALQLKSAQFEKQKRQGQLDALNNYRLDEADGRAHRDYITC